MFMEHEPQMPSRQERRKVSVGSITFFIQISASSTIGAQSSRSTLLLLMRRGIDPRAERNRGMLALRTALERYPAARQLAAAQPRLLSPHRREAPRRLAGPPTARNHGPAPLRQRYAEPSRRKL
jgi:hypothetical protein